MCVAVQCEVVRISDEHVAQERLARLTKVCTPTDIHA